MAENLKICPFCGKNPSTKVVVSKGLTKDVIKIEIGCYDCGVWRHNGILSGDSIEEFDKALQRVVFNWNRRVDNG